MPGPVAWLRKTPTLRPRRVPSLFCPAGRAVATPLGRSSGARHVPAFRSLLSTRSGSPPLRCFFSRSFPSYGVSVSVPPRRGIALAPLSGTLLLILVAAKGGLLATSAGPQFVLEVLLFLGLAAPSRCSFVASPLALLALVVPFEFLCSPVRQLFVTRHHPLCARVCPRVPTTVELGPTRSPWFQTSG